jgi:hypothetical protein
MRVVKFWTLSLGVLFIQACSSGQQPDPPPPPAKTVFDPMTQPLKRAQGVQAMIDQSADDTRKAVESQERGDPPRQ